MIIKKQIDKFKVLRREKKKPAVTSSNSFEKIDLSEKWYKLHQHFYKIDESSEQFVRIHHQLEIAEEKQQKAA